MKKLTRNKNQRGFTLVEVIVVAIIVAALAAVAIPLYNSYVTSSRNNAAANAAGSVASFMGACINQGGAATGITAGTATPGPITMTCGGTTLATAPTISVPSGVTVTVSALGASGQVTGISSSPGGTAQVYSY